MEFSSFSELTSKYYNKYASITSFVEEFRAYTPCRWEGEKYIIKIELIPANAGTFNSEVYCSKCPNYFAFVKADTLFKRARDVNSFKSFVTLQLKTSKSWCDKKDLAIDFLECTNDIWE